MVVGLAWALRPLAPHEGPENWFPNADKLHHMWVFALLWWMGVRARLGPSWPLALGLMAYAVVMEVAQGLLTTTRSASLVDVACDAAGVLLGFLILRRSALRALPEEHRR